MALSYMSLEKKGWISVKEMVEDLHCPFDPLSKVMQKLSDHHLVQSKKGIGGGYSFSGDLDKISLHQLMSIVLPPTDFASCFSGDCKLLNFCNIRKPIANLNEQLIYFYKGISMKKLLEDSNSKIERVNNN